MRKFATADCETDPFKHGRVPKPFVWGFYTKENGFIYFKETKDFVDHCKKFDGLIYFHNGGKFDIHYLLDDIASQDNVMIINGRIAKLKLGISELRDSFLLLPVPLSAYKKDEIDYNLFEEELRNKNDNFSKIVKYLEGDCVYLYEILEKQFETYGHKLTLASSAFDYWHKNFSLLKKKPKTGRDFFEQIKPFYYGGRVECFKKGILETDFEVCDINSAYPYAMQFEHSFGNEFIVTDKLPELEELNTCFIHFIGQSKGALPFRDKNGLKFPNDDEIREYKVTGWELKTALKYKKVKIKKVIRIYKFLNTINFTSYVDHFFKLKSELKGKDEAKYLLSKLYLNSLYGKFGQSSIDHREYSLVEKEYIEGFINAEYEYEGEMGNFALMSKEIDEIKMRFYNVATAASITGFVRAYLFEHILNAKTPIYCDTDSLACIKFNGNIGKNLGEWEKEGDFTQAAIGGKKLYAFKRKIPKNGEKYKISSKGAKLKYNEIISIAKGNEICYKNEAPTFSVAKTPNFVIRKIRLT